MSCYLCNGNVNVHWVYDKPDKYQGLINDESERRWEQCNYCGFWQQVNSLTDDMLKEIYSHYRDVSIRKELIEDTFGRISNLPHHKSENFERYKFFKDTFLGTLRVLDIGSGLGVWPDLLNVCRHHVTCVEPNKDSRQFIRLLGILCHETLSDVKPEKFDVVSMVHLLEHIGEPKPYLMEMDQFLKPEGRLFIEIPDACEFEYLSKNHDEFNSLHMFFYDLGTLHNMLQQTGYEIYAARQIRYKERNLTRLLVAAKPIV